MASIEGIQFERPIGAPADTSELEYVAALHQTNEEEIRINGTVHPKDIRNYLTSRHGVYVDHTIIEERIIKEMCGTYPGDGEDDDDEPVLKKKQKSRKKKKNPDLYEPMMDLCQMVALLSIPFLRQEDINEAAKGNNPLVHGMAENVMKLILEEMERNGINLRKYRAVDSNFETGTRITAKLIQAMLDTYGEYHVPDDVLQEMVQMASPTNDGGGSRSPIIEDDDDDDDDEEQQKNKDGGEVIMLNKDSFQRALTADVQLYQPDFETQQTTHLADVQSIDRPATRGQDDNIPFDANFYTAPSIDQAADQYRSFLWMIMLWISFLFYYMSYVFDRNGVVNFTGCSSQFGCDAASAVVNWLVVLVQFGICGLLYVYLASLGNAGHATLGSQKAGTGLGIIVAMGVVAAATIIPNFLEGRVFIWDTYKADGWFALYWATFAIGVFLILLQFIRLVDNFAGGVGPVGAGGRTRTEQCIKEAATKKINIMMDNAMLLHVTPMIAGEKPKVGGSRGWRFPAKHASEIVIRYAADLHDDQVASKRRRNYRDGTNIEALTGGDGSERALRHYKAMRDVTESVGGVMWAYERMADGRLYDEEGVWISARLMTSNVVQWLVVGAIIVTYFVALDWFAEQKANTVAVGQRRSLEEQEEEGAMSSRQQQEDGLREYVMEFEAALRQKQQLSYQRQQQQQQQQQQQHMMHRQRFHHHHRYLQYVQSVNSTHYSVAGQTGVFPNPIYDLNSTHFTDGTNVWPYAINSHNGTHVFDKYFAYNSSGFTDGRQYYPYAQFATNGTHITNGEYLFDGTTITALPGNTAVNNVEDWEFRVGLSVGLAAALAATVGIAVVYVPSFVSTVLKFRSGVFRSLRGRETFQQLRESPDRVTTLLGSAICGSVFSGAFCAFFAGGMSFLSVWSETRSVALQIHAFLIGVHVVILVNFLVIRLFRDLYVSFFYRRHPAAVNFINVLLESWNLALSIGTMWLRAVKVLGVTMSYIGRIDVPTFAPGVGYVGPFALDSEHFSFKNDLLIHEAHRHPYMERLGMMYLMKLHHGSSFGSRAGAYWRMLFVLALMPWLRQYRVRHFEDEKPDRSEEDGEDDEDGFVSEPTVIDDSSLMSLHGMELEMDVVKRANDSLTQRNRDLKKSVEDLRSKLKAANKQIAKLERRVERGATKSKTKQKPGPSSVDGDGQSQAKKPPRQTQKESKPAPAAQPAKEEVNEIDDDETFQSESDGKGGPVSLQQSEATPEEFEEEFQSDTEEETFSQAVAKERAKLEEQKRESTLRDESKGENGPASVQSSVVSADNDDFESDDDDIDEPLEEILRKRNAEQAAKGKKSSQPKGEQGAESDFETDDEFEDEFENEEEESLTHLLKKNKAKREKAERQAHRDPD